MYTSCKSSELDWLYSGSGSPRYHQCRILPCALAVLGELSASRIASIVHRLFVVQLTLGSLIRAIKGT